MHAEDQITNRIVSQHGSYRLIRSVHVQGTCLRAESPTGENILCGCRACGSALGWRPCDKEDGMRRILFLGIVASLTTGASALADNQSNCGLSAETIKKVQDQLLPVTQLADANGGIFKPNRMWSAIVDRDGNLCSIVNTDATNGDAWPGSRAIAIA